LAYSRLFSLAEQEANYQRIVDLAHRTESRDPRNVAHRGELGSALLYLQRYEEAKTVLEGHVSAGHADADAYLVLGEVWYQLDEPRKAKRYFETAAALAPYNSAMLFSLAKACAKLGETELATQYRAKFQELKDAETAAQKGDAGARQQVRDEVHIPIRIGEIMRHVGKAYQEANELELAEKSWLRGAALCPDDIGSRELLCDLYNRQGRLEESLKWVRELKRIAPQNRLHDRNEGLFLSGLKRYDEAERVFRELCRREPTGSLNYAALAELLLRRGGDVGEAQSLAQRAVAFDPSGPHLFLLAIVAHEAGDLTTARQAIGQALAREPENLQYRRLHASLSNQN
jgi:tetratricopeptide (TPR) repeat protein